MTPKIRLDGFTEEWEERKVSKITAFHKQGFYTTEPYDDGKKYYLLRGTDLTENRLVLKDTPKINATEKDYQAFKTQIGDFLIVRSGTVGTYGIVYDDIPAIFGSYLIDFRFDKSLVTNEFFGYFYQSDLFKNQLKIIIQQSANTNINAENIKSTSIKLPSIPEQKQIGDFFESLDDLITLHQRKCDTLEKTKQYFLQNMFPQKGEKVPRIRLEGFSGEWKDHTLGELYTERNERGNDSLQILSVSIHSGISDSQLDEEELGKTVRRSDDKSTYKHVYPGDLIFNMMRAWQGAIGTTKSEGMISPAYISAIPSADVYPMFMNYLLRRKEAIGQINNLSYGVTDFRKRLYWDSFVKVKCMLPSVDEQIAIADFFQGLDDRITLQQQKTDAMKSIKKFFLQNMFPDREV